MNFGKPKQPTILVCSLDVGVGVGVGEASPIGEASPPGEGEYQISKFQGNDRIQSPTFPELNLSAQQIFDAAISQ